jgi:hypothetical protein
LLAGIPRYRQGYPKNALYPFQIGFYKLEKRLELREKWDRYSWVIEFGWVI